MKFWILAILAIAVSLGVSQTNQVMFQMLSNSAPACSSGGVLVGGSCWYFGGDNVSCTTICSTRGGYNTATQSYAGSAGTNANCEAVLTALGMPGAVTQSTSCNAGYGCLRAYGSINYRCGPSPSTTSGAACSGGCERACACVN